MTAIREGSAKNTYIETPPQDSQMGSGYFRWTSKWSIFDYKNFGEFPWSVPYQDVAIPVILEKTYELLHSNGVATCVTEIENGKFGVYIVRCPGYELPFEPAQTPVGTNNRMVDLEVTFNLVVHPRSSLYKGWKNGEVDYSGRRFHQAPQPWEIIPIVKHGGVLFRYTTKFEKGGDRQLSDKEAKDRSRLTRRQWSQGIINSRKAALTVYRYAKELGLIYTDGKHEWMVDDERTVRIADLVGNPYDDRFIIKLRYPLWVHGHINAYRSMLGISSDVVGELEKRCSQQFNSYGGIYQDVGKQFLRNLYEDNGWRRRWAKERIPPPYPIERIPQVTGDMYLSVAQVWNRDDIRRLTGREARLLEDVAAELWVIEELNRMGQLPWKWNEGQPEQVKILRQL